jgi:hypothetical protein
MEAYPRRRGAVVVIRLERVAHVGAQFVPCASSADDAFPLRFGDENAVSLLGNLKYQLVHARGMRNNVAASK